MVEIIFLAPFITGLSAFWLPRTSGRPLLVFTGAIHLILSIQLWIFRPGAFFPVYFAVTPEGLLSLMVISLLFFLISIYTTAYLKMAAIRSERVFIGSMILFLSTMTLVTVSDHVMVMWIAIEATTLASAPLIFTQNKASALEATWKYVLICSVGIALALLGSVLISLSMDLGGVDAPMSFSALTAEAGHLDTLWLKTGFVFILVGYGTKMGLAPMHTWLPDAHSEAPSPASALLSGVLLNCAYLGIFKTNAIMHAAGLSGFSGPILKTFGLLSILAAAAFILRQTEYKRLLAYSSIENMGIIAFGTGVGGVAGYGAILCMIHHSLIKSALFLCSGNISMGYGSRWIEDIGRLAERMPKTFLAFFSGFAGISGFPPFGIFLGEFIIILGAFQAGHYGAAAVFILALCVIFAGIARHVLRIAFGDAAADIRPHEKHVLIWPQYALLLTSVFLCFWMPETLHQTIALALAATGGGF